MTVSPSAGTPGPDGTPPPVGPGPEPRRPGAGPDWARPDPRSEALLDYFVANESAFTREALVGQAEAAGYPREVIENALARLPGRLDRPRMENLKATSGRIVWALNGVGFLALAAWTVGQTYMGTYQLAVLAGQLVLVGLALALSLAAVRNRSSAPRGTVAALASLLALPLVIFVAFPGVCIYGFFVSRVGQ